MATVEVRVHIDRPVEHVWAVLVDWEGQPRWMQDARRVEVLSEHRTGSGVRLRVATDIAAGIVVTDEMVTTEWEPQRVIGVRHTGWLIKGTGAFELEPVSGGTVFTWWEEIDPPLGALGEAVTAAVVVPFVRRVFRRSLAALKVLCEQQPARGVEPAG